MRHLRLFITIILIIAWSGLAPQPAAASSDSRDPVLRERLALFERMQFLYGIPWPYLAAIDQYERTTTSKSNKSDTPASTRLTAITVPPEIWCGPLNPEQDDTDEASIRFFNGIGVDGSGDGKADMHDDVDVLTALIRYYSRFGFGRDDFLIGLWTYYKSDRTVKTIDEFATVYAKYQRLDLLRHTFPIPQRYSYTYRNTWGDARGWGGRRIHEGTDIFSDYGTPVLSTGYGIVEVVGWNKYGGWRIGIRDMENIYHYYAHLSAYRKGLAPGQIVEPGQVIGYVGSSGYGRPGTSGKFPPHLHYGMYKDTGYDEWAFDPFPYLKRWERQSRKR